MANHVYIHIPFCSYICSYCDFVKMVKVDKYYKKYLASLENEIRSRYQGEEIKTVYIGGGTPSILSSNEIIELGEMIKLLNLSDELEFTFEANPDSLSLDKLFSLKKIGVNRLSIGVQTFNQDVLKSFNRQHSNQMVENVIKQAKSVGFNNINVDLIYGYANQSLTDLKKNLEAFTALDIEHISIYSLQVESNSVFGKYDYKKINDELEADFYVYIRDYLEEKGFKQYEISNFSKIGYQSKHNNCYWELKDYYGFGLGAHSLIDLKRMANTKSMEKYIANQYQEEETTLTQNNLIEEFMFLGLRKTEGVSKDSFIKKFNKPIEFYYADVIIRLEKRKLIENTDFIKLTKQGLLLANDVFCELLID